MFEEEKYLDALLIAIMHKSLGYIWNALYNNLKILI